MTASSAKLCGLLGLSDLADDPAFVSNADRVTHRAGLTDRLSAATRAMTKAELLAACEANGVPAGPINDMAEVFSDPQVIARALQIAPGGVPGVRSPMSFSGAELSLARPRRVWVSIRPRFSAEGEKAGGQPPGALSGRSPRDIFRQMKRGSLFGIGRLALRDHGLRLARQIALFYLQLRELFRLKREVD